MKEFLKKIKVKIRDITENHGFVCDACGGEVFSYPRERLCADCEKSMRKIESNACPKCGRELQSKGVCLTCKSSMPKFTKGIAPVVYRGETAALVNRVKNGAPRLARYFGENMARAFAREFPDYAKEGNALLLVPVPLTQEKYRLRGYNQSERLAQAVQEELERLGFTAETDAEILQKVKDSSEQKHMGKAERAANVAGAYHVHKRKACQGRRILLIDDIMTTGATGSECAARLLGAGAKEVYLLAAAAVPEGK